MRSPLRSALLLGSALAMMSTSSAFADDPLVPEGAERPKMGKELILPPVINDAPPGTPIVLPPPGQEHLLGQRPAGAKSEARLDDEPAAKADAQVEAEGGSDAQALAETPEPPKKKKRKAKAHAVAAAEPKAETAPVAEIPADKALYAGIKKTGVPDQSLVVPEDASAAVAPPQTKTAGIVKTEARLDDAMPPMGGPELSGPPKPTDGMTDAPAPIRDGDALTAKQERALADAPAKAEKGKPAKPSLAAAPAEPAKAPAIERFEIAQATAAPLPVTPDSARVEPDWNVAVSAGIGWGLIDSARQGYLGAANGAGVPTATRAIRSDNSDEAFDFQLAAKFNLAERVEPLGGGSNVEPFLKLTLGGHEVDFASGPTAFTPGGGASLLIQGNGPGAGLTSNAVIAGGSASNAVYRGKQQQIRGAAIYGQTWRGRSMDVTGFAGFAHARRDIDHTLTFKAAGSLDGGAVTSFDGRYDTDLDSNTTSFMLGAGVSAPLTSDGRVKVDANIRGSYDITVAKGNDQMRLVDVAGPTVRRSVTTPLRRTEESFGYGAGVGLSYEVGNGIGVRLGADYASQEAAPVVVRDGVNPSRLELEREDVLTGTLTATFKF